MNKDLFPHSATGPKGTFDSASIPAGGSWSFVARRNRHVRLYVRSFTPTMKATLTVR